MNSTMTEQADDYMGLPEYMMLGVSQERWDRLSIQLFNNGGEMWIEEFDDHDITFRPYG